MVFLVGTPRTCVEILAFAEQRPVFRELQIQRVDATCTFHPQAALGDEHPLSGLVFSPVCHETCALPQMIPDRIRLALPTSGSISMLRFNCEARTSFITADQPRGAVQESSQLSSFQLLLLRTAGFSGVLASKHPSNPPKTQ